MMTAVCVVIYQKPWSPGARQAAVNPSCAIQKSCLGQVEAMKTRQTVRKMMQGMRKLNPGLIQALVDERDQVRPLKDPVIPGVSCIQ